MKHAASHTRPDRARPGARESFRNRMIAGFKVKGDWDEKHSVPKSQCFECDPSLKQKFAAAYKERYGKDAPMESNGDKH